MKVIKSIISSESGFDLFLGIDSNGYYTTYNSVTEAKAILSSPVHLITPSPVRPVANHVKELQVLELPGVDQTYFQCNYIFC